jgi:signal transduction histidine kinase
VIAGLLAVVLVAWTASRISRPLARLTEKTSRVDLDRLDVDFTTRRTDEIGTLSRVLGAMTSRLRASAAHIKDAERRATLGEMARQVNHDIKNGLTPIRNVFRHLTQIADDDPGRMPGVFKDREETIESSISYLETLASNYARLSPRIDRRPCDINDIAGGVVESLDPGDENIDLSFEPGDLRGGSILGDPLSVRRIFENIIDNAMGSLGDTGGKVAVATERVVRDGDDMIRITVTDTGSGMSSDRVSKIFDDFFTTKDQGTGLGLSIVRRLVMDLGGTIDVTSEVGKGSRFQIDLPVDAPVT